MKGVGVQESPREPLQLLCSERWFEQGRNFNMNSQPRHSSAQIPSLAALGASDNQSSSCQGPPALSSTVRRSREEIQGGNPLPGSLCLPQAGTASLSSRARNTPGCWSGASPSMDIPQCPAAPAAAPTKLEEVSTSSLSSGTCAWKQLLLFPKSDENLDAFMFFSFLKKTPTFKIFDVCY